jgi:hypothetical protein
MAAIGRAFGVSRQAVSKFISTHPELQARYEDNVEGILDNAESALHRAVLAGEPWAIKYVLSTRGKNRGYVERTEHKHAGPVGIDLTEVIVRTREEAQEFLRRTSKAKLSR